MKQNKIATMFDDLISAVKEQVSTKSNIIPDIITFARAAQTDIKQALEGIANSDRIWGEPFFLPFVD